MHFLQFGGYTCSPPCKGWGSAFLFLKFRLDDTAIEIERCDFGSGPRFEIHTMQTSAFVTQGTQPFEAALRLF